MGLINKLFNSGKEAIAKVARPVTLASCILVGSMLPFVTGCGDSGGGDGSSDSNHAPEITTSIGATTGQAGVPYTHDVDATDPDSDPVTYTLTTYPSGMTINSSSGVINWTPDIGDEGINHPLTVKASDGSKSDTQSWGIYISGSGDPTITTTANTDGIEGILYQYDVDATDPESDPITFSLGTAPSGMLINSSTGVISWTPTIPQERQFHNVTVYADDDFGGHAEQSYQVWPRGRENVSGNVKALGSGTNIPDITVTVTEATTGAYQTQTDASGNWTLTNIPDGDNDTMFTDGLGTYETFKPGKLRVSATSHKSGLQTRLALKTDEAFMRDCARMDPIVPADDDHMKRWENKPIFDVFLVDMQDNAVSSANETGVKNVIKNELNTYTKGILGTFTDADIVPHYNKPSGLPADGHIWVYWSNSILGVNDSYFNGNKISSAYAGFNPSVGKGTWMQELTETLIGSGETTDGSNYLDSILHDPRTVTSYSSDDIKLSDFHYGTYNIGGDTLWFRATGNRDEGTADNHDRNPDDYIWNETLP